MGEMSVKVEMSEADIRLGTQRLCSKLAKKQIALFLVAIVIGFFINQEILVFAQKLAVYQNLPSNIQMLLGIVTLVLIYIYVFKFLSHYSPIQYYHPDGIMRCPKEIRVAPDGVHHESALYVSRTNWSAVMKVEEDKDFIFLYVDIVSAYTIPKRSFNSPEEASAFLTQAREYWSAAHPQGADAKTGCPA